MALCRVAGGASSAGMTDSRKRSTSCRFCSRYFLMSMAEVSLTSLQKRVNARRGVGQSFDGREVEGEREFAAAARKDGELGFRKRVEVAVGERRHDFGAVGR